MQLLKIQVSAAADGPTQLAASRHCVVHKGGRSVCDKLVTVVSQTKLTTLATVKTVLWCNFSKSRV